jgi:peptide/nickel transport system ATP-binding protein
MSLAPLDDVTDAIMLVENVSKAFRSGSSFGARWRLGATSEIRAVDGVSLRIGNGELLGLIGESGSGKTTLARLLTRLETCDSGVIRLRAQQNLAELKGTGLRTFYRHVQMIFQDPFESINPRFTVHETVTEPLRAQGIGSRETRPQMVKRAMERAGLRPIRKYIPRYPHELSGGERQRLSIARALVLEPRLIIADEPVSMLDVSIRAGILNLLKELSVRDGLSVLYISHDLSTTRYLCDRIAIMYRGKIVEIGPTDQVLENPLHPYARMLRSAVPNADPNVSRPRLAESVAEESLHVEFSGCRYAAECPYAMDKCRATVPMLMDASPEHRVACHLLKTEVRDELHPPA